VRGRDWEWKKKQLIKLTKLGQKKKEERDGDGDGDGDLVWRKFSVRIEWMRKRIRGNKKKREVIEREVWETL